MKQDSFEYLRMLFIPGNRDFSKLFESLTMMYSPFLIAHYYVFKDQLTTYGSSHPHWDSRCNPEPPKVQVQQDQPQISWPCHGIQTDPDKTEAIHIQHQFLSSGGSCGWWTSSGSSHLTLQNLHSHSESCSVSPEHGHRIRLSPQPST